jgi:hypothetical protein
LLVGGAGSKGGRAAIVVNLGDCVAQKWREKKSGFAGVQRHDAEAPRCDAKHFGGVN